MLKVVLPDITALATDFRNSLDLNTPLSKEDLAEVCDRFSQKLEVTAQQQHAVEFQTRRQSKIELWHKMRYGRLTSSQFGSIVKHVAPAERLVARLLQPPRTLMVPPIRWGQDNEAAAHTAYIAYQHRSGKQELKVTDSGLVLMKNGYLGCSPDGIVWDPAACDGQQKGLLELKCPYSVKDSEVVSACGQVKNFPCHLLPNGTLELKKEHPYYFQIQGGMALTDTSWCDFVMWSPQWISLQRIPFDHELWEGLMLPKLSDFYQDWMLPQLLQLGNKMTASSFHEKPTSPTLQDTCCAACRFSGHLLRSCVHCHYIFHHMCTTD